MGHEFMDHAKKRAPPSTAALRMVFLASALPFVGFGFLDNFIMLAAGEEIDAVFGARLGLTTLASAGLGNLVADVCGVSAANMIEVWCTTAQCMIYSCKKHLHGDLLMQETLAW